MSEYPTPKFAIGDTVLFEISTKVQEFDLSKILPFTVVGIRLSSDDQKRLIVYDLSADPTAAYHSGKINFSNVDENRLATPSPEPAQKGKADAASVEHS